MFTYMTCSYLLKCVFFWHRLNDTTWLQACFTPKYRPSVVIDFDHDSNNTWALNKSCCIETKFGTSKMASYVWKLFQHVYNVLFSSLGFVILWMQKYCVLVWDICKHVMQSKFIAWVHYSVIIFSLNLLIISLFNECSRAILILNVMFISIINNMASWLVRVFISYTINQALDFHCSETQQHL